MTQQLNTGHTYTVITHNQNTGQTNTATTQKLNTGQNYTVITHNKKLDRLTQS